MTEQSSESGSTPTGASPRLIEIIAEYTRPGANEQHRRNACVALGAIGGEGAVGLLVELGLDDARSVRQSAAAEIIALDEAGRIAALDTFRARIGSGDTTGNASALLGELRRLGLDVPRAGVPWLQRLRLAREKSANDVRESAARARQAVGLQSFIGTFLGLCLFVGVLFHHFGNRPLDLGLVVIMASAMVFGPVLSVLMMPHLRAFGRHWDNVSSLVVDLGRILLWFSLPAAVLAGVALLVPTNEGSTTATPISFGYAGVLLFVSLVLFPVLVRVATVLVHDVFESRILRLVAQAFAGGAAGFVCLSLVVSWAGTHDRIGLDSLVLAWTALVPSGVGLACGYAWVDSDRSPRLGRRSPAGALVCLVLLGGAVFAVSRSIGDRAASYRFAVIEGEPTTRIIKLLPERPQSLGISALGRLQVVAEGAATADRYWDHAIGLLDGAGRTLVEQGVDSGINIGIERGAYLLLARRRDGDEPNPRDILSVGLWELTTLLASRWGSAETQALALNVTASALPKLVREIEKLDALDGKTVTIPSARRIPFRTEDPRRVSVTLAKSSEDRALNGGSGREASMRSVLNEAAEFVAPGGSHWLRIGPDERFLDERGLRGFPPAGLKPGQESSGQVFEPLEIRFDVKAFDPDSLTDLGSLASGHHELYVRADSIVSLSINAPGTLMVLYPNRQVLGPFPTRGWPETRPPRARVASGLDLTLRSSKDDSTVAGTKDGSGFETPLERGEYHLIVGQPPSRTSSEDTREQVLAIRRLLVDYVLPGEVNRDLGELPARDSTHYIPGGVPVPFEIRESSRISIDVPKHLPDYVLSLYNSDGVELAFNDDDPERIEGFHLGTGRYWVVVVKIDDYDREKNAISVRAREQSDEATGGSPPSMAEAQSPRPVRIHITREPMT